MIPCSCRVTIRPRSSLFQRGPGIESRLYPYWSWGGTAITGLQRARRANAYIGHLLIEVFDVGQEQLLSDIVPRARRWNNTQIARKEAALLT